MAFWKTIRDLIKHMKKIILQILTGFLAISCSSTKELNTNNIAEQPVSADFTGKVDSQNLDLIKQHYHWKDEEILIINYKQPISSCHFNNNKITSKSKNWWNEFYFKIKTDNTLNIHVLANGEKVKNKLDDLKYFDDKNDLLWNNFFYRKKSCFGVLVLNKDGDYFQYNGHYSERQVEVFIDSLKK